MMALVQQWQAVTAQRLDLALFLPALALALIGYIMITSASMDVVAVQFNDPFNKVKVSFYSCFWAVLHFWFV